MPVQKLKKPKLKTFTIADIRALSPCYDPATYLPDNWKGTTLDVLSVSKCPVQDRLWVVLHEGWAPVNTMVLFACWCARQAIRYSKEKPDERSLAAIELAERFGNGERIPENELRTTTNAAAAAAATYADAIYAAATYAAAARKRARGAQIKQLKSMLKAITE